MTASGHRRVVVTGWGALSPGGIGIGAYRDWLAAAEPRPGCVPDFVPSAFIQSPKLLRSMHRTFQLVAAASVLAMRAAHLPTAESLVAALPPERAGIAAALTDLSPLTPDLLRVLALTAPDAAAPIPWAAFAEASLHSLHPFRRLTLLANMAAAHTSLLFGLQGPSFTFTSGGAAGGQTITQAFWTITHDRADLMLCQAAESPEQSFSAAPVAEIGGALVLEDWDSAHRRGAHCLAELVSPPPEAAPAAPYFSLGRPTAVSPAAGLLNALLQLDAAHAAHHCTPIALPELLTDFPQPTLAAEPS